MHLRLQNVHCSRFAHRKRLGPASGLLMQTTSTNCENESALRARRTFAPSPDAPARSGHGGKIARENRVRRGLAHLLRAGTSYGCEIVMLIAAVFIASGSARA